ncbi:MAG: helix-turn-helix transcriptional regulator [Spirochaetaceae bacterium]|nr:helix-turn-helix transcriptional regulator [Spirochaetaceae bacterium]
MEDIKHILKPVIDLEKTGEKIKTLRKNNGFSVHELQLLFGFEYPQAIYAWEAGKNIPTVDNLIVLSRLYSVSMDEIICYTLNDILCSCTDHVANCMNKDAKVCESCKFRKSA